MFVDKNNAPITKQRRFLHFMLGQGITILCFLAIILGHKINQELFLKYLNYDSSYSETETLSYELIESLLSLEASVQAFLYPMSFLFFLYVINWIPFFLKKYNRPFHDIISGVHVVYSEERAPSPRSIMKTITIVAFYISLLPTIHLSLWTVYNFFDRPLNPEVNKFFYLNDFKLENNVRIAWAGLQAPAETKDIYEYGLKIYNKEIENTSPLEFKGEETVKGECLAKDTAPKPLSENDIKTLYNDNKELIDRYTTLYNYKNYGADNRLEGPGSGQTIITIHRFLEPYWEHMAKNGRSEDAIKWWLKDMELIQNMMGRNTDLVEKAIWIVNYGLNITALPLILKADPTLVEKYEQPITDILNKDFMKDIWNVENTWRAEYNALRFMQISKIPHHLLLLKPNDMRNEFLKIAKDMIALSKKPVNEIAPSFDNIMTKHDCFKNRAYWFFPYNITGRIILSSIPKGWEMYTNGHAITARHRALILWMQAHKQNIPPEQMEEFLASAPENLYDNLTGKPFRWDAEKNSIYITWETYKKIRTDIIYE